MAICNLSQPATGKPRLSPLFPVVEAVALEFAVEGGPVHAQDLRDALFFLMPAQQQLNVAALQFIQGGPVRDQARGLVVELGPAEGFFQHIRLNLGGQVVHGDLPASAQLGQVLQGVAQLPHVPGPGIGLQHMAGLPLHQIDLVVLPAELGQEVVDERRDVLAPVPQGRHPQFHDTEPVVEILPEGSGLDHQLQVAVGGGDDPGIHLDGLVAAHAADLLLLEHPQEAHLEARAGLADLVEEDRAAGGLLE